MSDRNAPKPEGWPRVDLPADAWLAEATPIVEDSLNRLIREFATHPYLHRVEHSLHARLLGLLTDNPLFAGLAPIGDGARYTQPVHKEWPETIPRPNKRGRGNFDIAILSRDQLRAATLDEFRDGRIAAGIVIELGLDYDLKHLSDDAAKLENSRVSRAYLVNLVRATGPDTSVRSWIQGYAGPARVGYVHHDGRAGSCETKTVDRSEFTTIVSDSGRT